MTQEYRWLAAVALLLALGAGAVRAEEEEEEVRLNPVHSVAELLPPPRPVVAEPSQVVVMPASLPAPPWASFILPSPFPCPCPVGMPAGMCGYPCGPISMPCPCATGACPAPAGLWHPLTEGDSPPQYVVTTKMVKAGEDDADAVTTCPRITVLENQTATLHLQGYETANESSGLHIELTVSKQGQGAQIDLLLSEGSSHDGGPSGLRTHTETTETRCNIPFGQPYKMELPHGAWLEVTVTEVETEQRVHQAACGGGCHGTCHTMTPLTDNDADASPMDAAGEIVGCLCEVLGDAVNSAFGWAISTEDEADLPPSPYLEQPPPPYIRPGPAFPVTRELATQEGCTASCPNSECGECGCTQCATAEAVKKAETRLSIDAMHDRKKLDVTGGGKHWTAEADAITLHEDCILLQGHVVAESCDEGCHESMVIKADVIRLERKDGGLEIHVEGKGNVRTRTDD